MLVCEGSSDLLAWKHAKAEGTQAAVIDQTKSMRKVLLERAQDDQRRRHHVALFVLAHQAWAGGKTLPLSS